MNKKNQKGYVYILKDLNDKFYVGSTTNLDRRLKQHRVGHTQTTHRMQLPVLVLSQEYDTIAIARSIELKIKSLKRKDYIEKMVRDRYIKIMLS